jgi:hypothetical protein
MFGQSTTDSYTYNYVSFTALADGGQLSAPFSPITRWRKAGGAFLR